MHTKKVGYEYDDLYIIFKEEAEDQIVACEAIVQEVKKS